MHQNLENAIAAELRKALFNVVLLGYPGAGCGTQARRLAAKYHLSYVSSRELIRNEIDGGTEIGQAVKPIFDRGGLVPDEIVIKLIERRFREHPEALGFVFKGFPRTIVQAYILDGMLRKMGSSVSCVVDIQLSMLELIKRLDARGKTDRRMSYDLETATIVKRLEEHEQKCLPLVGYYQKHLTVTAISGEGTEDEVFARLAGPVEQAWRRAR
ncbi:MAG TPA: adenylate kinase [Candidatus Krumholzibacteria bacterium]|nr:adenylate kinase [Candidatus Krumholzibacteria bacterium]